MFRFLCVLFYVINGVKYQARGYSWVNCAQANSDAFEKLVAVIVADGADQNAPITRRGEEYYKDGRPYCLDYWENGQTPSPWSPAWMYATE